MNKDIFLGKTPEGTLVDVSIRVDPISRPMMTVEHEPVAGGFELGISANEWDPFDMSDIVRGGQMVDRIPDVLPSEQWTREDLDRLLAIWRRWHLNTMRAACAHMVLPDDTSYEARRHIVCPKQAAARVKTLALTDTPVVARDITPAPYRYGSSWLYEPLPPDVLQDVRRFQRRLNAPGYRLTDGLAS